MRFYLFFLSTFMLNVMQIKTTFSGNANDGVLKRIPVDYSNQNYKIHEKIDSITFYKDNGKHKSLEVSGHERIRKYIISDRSKDEKNVSKEQVAKPGGELPSHFAKHELQRKRLIDNKNIKYIMHPKHRKSNVLAKSGGSVKEMNMEDVSTEIDQNVNPDLERNIPGSEIEMFSVTENQTPVSNVHEDRKEDLSSMETNEELLTNNNEKPTMNNKLNESPKKNGLIEDEDATVLEVIEEAVEHEFEKSEEELEEKDEERIKEVVNNIEELKKDELKEETIQIDDENKQKEIYKMTVEHQKKLRKERIEKMRKRIKQRKDEETKQKIIEASNKIDSIEVKQRFQQQNAATIDANKTASHSIVITSSLLVIAAAVALTIYGLRHKKISFGPDVGTITLCCCPRQTTNKTFPCLIGKPIRMSSSSSTLDFQ